MTRSQWSSYPVLSRVLARISYNLNIFFNSEKLTQGASKTVEFRDAIDLIVYYSGQTQNDFRSVKKFTYQPTGWTEYPYFTPEVTVNAKIGMDGTKDKALVIIGQMNEESEERM